MYIHFTQDGRTVVSSDRVPLDWSTVTTHQIIAGVDVNLIRVRLKHGWGYLQTTQLGVCVFSAAIVSQDPDARILLDFEVIPVGRAYPEIAVRRLEAIRGHDFGMYDSSVENRIYFDLTRPFIVRDRKILDLTGRLLRNRIGKIVVEFPLTLTGTISWKPNRKEIRLGSSRQTYSELNRQGFHKKIFTFREGQLNEQVLTLILSPEEYFQFEDIVRRERDPHPESEEVLSSPIMFFLLIQVRKMVYVHFMEDGTTLVSEIKRHPWTVHTQSFSCFSSQSSKTYPRSKSNLYSDRSTQKD
jgi:hypothetical protein